MSRDEARKLLGGYATGSLTEAERTALFQAALEDQELFDELAGEQVLKEVLDEPGARQRLIAALEPPRHRAWLWAAAAATATMAIVVGFVVSQRTTPAPQQIAQVLKSPELVAAPEMVAPREPVAPQIAAPTPAPAPAPPKVPLGPPPPPAASPEPPAKLKDLKKAENAVVSAQADQLQEAKPQAAAGAIRQFAAARTRSVFGFNYSVGADGFLEITPAAPGFLSVTASDAAAYPTAVVNAGTAVRIAIPSGATSLVIAFSETPGITGSPVRRDAPAGRETDQDPPNGRILIQLFLTPTTR